MDKESRLAKSTSWQPVQKWYDKLVGEDGHYYHQNIILPGVIKLLQIKENQEGDFLDLACGQGVLARSLPGSFSYTGVDISPSLIASAKKQNSHSKHSYLIADVTKPLKIPQSSFSHAAIILALQNIEKGDKVFQNLALHLRPMGKCVVVLNHPYYRIPRQSSWQIDESKKLQYRRIDSYLSPMQIPIQMQPKKGSASETTWSFHYPLSTYINWGIGAGFMLAGMEEWVSDKISTGKTSKMENRARQEFPLFMALLFQKL